MKKSIKLQLFLFFSLFTFISVIISFAGWHYLSKNNHSFQFSRMLNQIFAGYIKISEVEQQILNSKHINQQEYDNTIKMHTVLVNKTIDQIQVLKTNYQGESLFLDSELENLKNGLNSYKSSFKSLSDKIRKKGWSKFGYESDIELLALEIESKNLVINQKCWTEIKKLEKEFFDNQDSLYLNMIDKNLKKMVLESSSSPYFNLQKKLDAQFYFFKYNTMLKNMARLNNEIGKNGSGISGEFKKTKLKLENSYSNLINITQRNETNNINEMNYNFIYVTICLIMFSGFLSYFLSDYFTRPIKNLTEQIQDSIESNFHSVNNVHIENVPNEIGFLIQQFNEMQKRLKLFISSGKEQNDLLGRKNIDLQKINNQLELSQNELSKLNQVKDRFFAILSHDLKSPFNTISGFLKMIEEYADRLSPAELKEFSVSLNKSIEDIREMLENLLQWSLMQTDNIQYKLEYVDIFDLSEKNARILRLVAQNKNVTIINEIEPKYQVYGDKNMIDFIIRNLISNAIKFTSDNGMVYIRKGETDYSIVVADTGIGMTEEQTDKLFDVQTHFTTKGTKKETGTGLGLVVCYEFMTKMEGSIRVQSVAGKGTSFILTFIA